MSSIDSSNAKIQEIRFPSKDVITEKLNVDLNCLSVFKRNINLLLFINRVIVFCSNKTFRKESFENELKVKFTSDQMFKNMEYRSSILVLNELIRQLESIYFYL